MYANESSEPQVGLNVVIGFLYVFSYRIGQLYMISKHSHEQSERGEGVEVVQNEPFEDPTHGHGQFTEKRVYLNSKLPSWARAVVPRIFYVTEKAWNYYPYTITAVSPADSDSGKRAVNVFRSSLKVGDKLFKCSFLPKFSIHIETKYEDNKGSNDNIFESELKDQEREVCFVDIAYDEIPERYYKESEDLRYFKSEKTSRGMLQEGWRDTETPIMCSYKLVTVKFEVWGLQTRVEQFVHKVVRDVLLLGHRQAFAWVDEWIDMDLEDVREYENQMHEKTNIKVCLEQQEHSTNSSPSLDGLKILDKVSCDVLEVVSKSSETLSVSFLEFPPSDALRPATIHTTDYSIAVNLPNHVKRLGNRFAQIHAEFNVCSLLQLAVHDEIADAVMQNSSDMTMDEVREYERRSQEATNQKIGMFPPSISIGEMPLSSQAPSGPASAPSTPLYTDAPEFLSVPKERPRKKSAPETLTLSEPGQSVPVPAPNHASLSPASNETE
ncbi:cytoplasmic phosphatidylinositol transfer protein 1 isoform X1 [Silurus meridionalis]|nr:cytoplasmic phosphatidylinositol transfer protein 1 isoform X1 [Silurus meridionalis]